MSTPLSISTNRVKLLALLFKLRLYKSKLDNFYYGSNHKITKNISDDPYN